MDSVVAKAIVSRKKSIGVLEAEVAALELRVKACTLPAPAVVLREMLKVKQQRLSKLQAELVGLEELVKAEAGPELPFNGGAGGPGRPPRR